METVQLSNCVISLRFVPDFLTYHLSGNVKAGSEVELATALLEEVFEALAEQIHHHYMVCLAIVRLLVTNKVKEGHVSLASQLVN